MRSEKEKLRILSALYLLIYLLFFFLTFYMTCFFKKERVFFIFKVTVYWEEIAISSITYLSEIFAHIFSSSHNLYLKEGSERTLKFGMPSASVDKILIELLCTSLFSRH